MVQRPSFVILFYKISYLEYMYLRDGHLNPNPPSRSVHINNINVVFALLTFSHTITLLSEKLHRGKLITNCTCPVLR